MKHRGPDSTGVALYRAPTNDLILRVKLADASDLDDITGAADIRRRRRETEARITSAGAHIQRIEDANAYTFTATLDYDGDLKKLADHVESVPRVEVLSLGHALEIVKDLGDANTVNSASVTSVRSERTRSRSAAPRLATTASGRIISSSASM